MLTAAVAEQGFLAQHTSSAALQPDIPSTQKPRLEVHALQVAEPFTVTPCSINVNYSNEALQATKISAAEEK